LRAPHRIGTGQRRHRVLALHPRIRAPRPQRVHHPRPGENRRRRLHRLVQHQTPPLHLRRPSPGRLRTPGPTRPEPTRGPPGQRHHRGDGSRRRSFLRARCRAGNAAHHTRPPLQGQGPLRGRLTAVALRAILDPGGLYGLVARQTGPGREPGPWDARRRPSQGRTARPIPHSNIWLAVGMKRSRSKGREPTTTSPPPGGAHGPAKPTNEKIIHTSTHHAALPAVDDQV